MGLVSDSDLENEVVDNELLFCFFDFEVGKIGVECSYESVLCGLLGI